MHPELYHLELTMNTFQYSHSQMIRSKRVKDELVVLSADDIPLKAVYVVYDRSRNTTGTSIEVLSDGCGMGAMGLFLPTMETLSGQNRWQAFIAPPYTPYAPLLSARGIDTQQVLLVHPQNREDLLWSTEQALRSGTCSVVFSWLGATEYRYSELRKLQLAAAESDTLAVLFRSNDAQHNHSPAGLRLQMREYRRVRILKQRGGRQDLDVTLSPSNDVPQQPQLWELSASNPTSSTGFSAGIA